MKSMCVYKYCD